MFLPNELILIRHAEPDHGGTLCGRTDVGLTQQGLEDIARVSERMPTLSKLYSSPAKRCVLTAEGLFPKMMRYEESALWEQDFGDWEGRPFDTLPDIGDLGRDELAKTPVPGGESYDDMGRRSEPILRRAADAALAGGPVAVVAHAGIVRVGLSMALGVSSAGLSFQVPALSFTRLQCFPGGKFAIAAVGWTAV